MYRLHFSLSAHNQMVNVQRQYTKHVNVEHNERKTQNTIKIIQYIWIVQKPKKGDFLFAVALFLRSSHSFSTHTHISLFFRSTFGIREHEHVAFFVCTLFSTLFGCCVSSPYRLSCLLFLLWVSSFVLVWCDLFIIILHIILSHEKKKTHDGEENERREILCAKHKMLLRIFIWNEWEKSSCQKTKIEMKTYALSATHSFKHTYISVHVSKSDSPYIFFFGAVQIAAETRETCNICKRYIA